MKLLEHEIQRHVQAYGFVSRRCCHALLLAMDISKARYCYDSEVRLGVPCLSRQMGAYYQRNFRMLSEK